MYKITLICVLFGLLNVIKCDWWENTLIYEISTKSFKDSDGDGIGDINGITSKLDYIADLGADAIWLPGIYASSSDDLAKNPREIMNHMQLNPMFGTMDDFRKLSTKAKEKGLKIILNFVPGYTSKDHIWFLKSVQNETKYTDYYIWADPSGFSNDDLPNEPEGGLGINRYFYKWIFSNTRRQFYCSMVYDECPKLNLKNPNVADEMKKLLRFWLDTGVDGFLVNDPSELIFTSNTNHSEESITDSHKLLHNFREILEEYKNNDGSTRLLIVDSENVFDARTFYDKDDYKISHFAFNHRHLMSHFYGFVNAKMIKHNIDLLFEVTPKGKVSAWASESHLRARIPAGWGLEYICIAAVQTLLLPGVASIFYGQEIGLRGIEIYTEDNLAFIEWLKSDFMLGFMDPTAANCPMQWDNTDNNGFTNSPKGPWSDIRHDAWKFNVEVQKRKKDSYYNFYKELIKLRKTDTCKFGDVETFILSKYGFAFTRSQPGKEMYIALFNFDYKNGNIELSTLLPKSAKSLTVLLGSPNSYQKTGEILNTNSNGGLVIEMRPLSVIILTTSTTSSME